MKRVLKLTSLFLLAMVVSSCSNDDDQPQVSTQYTLNDLQGKWYRVNSTNPTADGMEVTVTDNQGKVTDPANSGFQLNSIKWKDITQTGDSDFEHEELGSNNAYYSGYMEYTHDDTLRIWVNYVAPGSEQKWVRTYQP